MRLNTSNGLPDGSRNNFLKQIDRKTQVRERLQAKLEAKKKAEEEKASGEALI
tara:strand:+ start:2179 stop:2337 length:159 start_codon:yes stop_codon:yes gene_type:complete